MSRTSALSTFHRTMALITVGTPLTEVLEAIIHAVEAEDPSIACSIYLLDRPSSMLRLAAAPSLPTDYRNAVVAAPIGPDIGSCPVAAYRNERIVVEDLQTDPRWAPIRRLVEGTGLCACWSEPIRGLQGEVLGTFAMYHRRICAPGPDDIGFLEAAAQLASLAIARDTAQEDLARSEARVARLEQSELDALRNLKTFFDVSLDLLCIRDLDRRIVRVNRAWETILGYTVEELEGASMLALIHPDDAGASVGLMEQADDGGEVIGFVNRYRHKDGNYRHFEWRARRVGDLVFGMARDVTERLAIEAEMAAAREAAEAANRAKSEFLANMSHEIRTPLNGVIGVVAALARTELTPAQGEMVALIESSGVTLERLVSGVLDFSKIEAGRLEIENGVFDLQAELDQVIDVFRVRAEEKGLTFPVRYGLRARGEFIGDSVRIKQILSNLLSNAIKFTIRGEVRVALDIEEPTDPGQASRLVLLVSDSGVGFEAEFGRQLFQRFSQADTTITRRFGGTGLGLSITRALVELMDGEISAGSEPGRGSEFRVVLPLPRDCALEDYDAGPRDAAAGGAVDEAGDGLGGLSVLLADDHPINQRVVQLILEPFGVALTTVDNGQEAVEAFASGSFELVLMDMQMPVMDGLAATKAIRRWEAEHPSRSRSTIVMLSANAMREHRLEAEQAGADLHLPKPVTAASLVAGMIEALELSTASTGAFA
jgi:two-component system, sensor histidine kinase